MEDSGVGSPLPQGVRNVKPKNLPIPNLQTFVPHMPDIVKPSYPDIRFGHYTCKIVVCQVSCMHEIAHKNLPKPGENLPES